MTAPPRDDSRDRRIEDPSNLWLIHPAARRLLPVALARGISANAVSIIGLLLGVGAALAYAHWTQPLFAVLGLALSIGWLIADGLDGMVARATGTASPVGRLLDGVVDHGVFILIYLVLAHSYETLEAWLLAFAAGAAHAVQSSLYEGERARYHRRVRGIAAPGPAALSGGAVVRGYDRLATSLDRLGQPFERLLGMSDDPAALGRTYGTRAASVLKLQSLLSANVRVAVIFLACLVGNPRLFWWFELLPLTAIAIAGILLHRRVERSFLDGRKPGSRRWLGFPSHPKEHGH